MTRACLRLHDVPHQERFAVADIMMRQGRPDCAPTPLLTEMSGPAFWLGKAGITVEPVCVQVVLATNIAETSITVPGVRYVVDAGFVKTREYDAQTGADALHVAPISQAQAAQRSGRAGVLSCVTLLCSAAFGRYGHVWTHMARQEGAPSADNANGRVQD